MRINKTSYKSTTIDDYNTIIDVRTPLEFDDDHIPRSVNYPVLTNKQRHEIGLKYKENSFLAKKEGASIISANISKIINKIKFDKKNKTLIYCWRGGLRSLSLYLVLKQIGYDVTLLEGGYKTYRGYVVDFFENNTERKTNNETLNILLIQPNLYESLVEFDVLRNLEIYEKLTLEALTNSPKADLIIWPEGSLPIDLNNRDGLLSRLSSLINEDQKIIVGSSAIEENQLFNRLYIIDHQGKIIDFYDKQKLVLFGEYIPFVKPIVSKFLNLGMNYTPGTNQKILKLQKNINAVPMICFESIFNYKSINTEVCNADMVIQISNDSWFGKWYGPHQHLANSLLRSVEFQKPLIRSTPSGITSVVDYSGKIIETIPTNKKGYLYYQHPINKYKSNSII